MKAKADALPNIREVAQKILPPEVFISDNVYRPFDMRPFGVRGYSLVLSQAPNKTVGINLGNDPPSDEQIEEGVRRILTVFGHA
jgi:hypothetical protein